MRGCRYEVSIRCILLQALVEPLQPAKLPFSTEVLEHVPSWQIAREGAGFCRRAHQARRRRRLQLISQIHRLTPIQRNEPCDLQGQQPRASA